MGAFENEVQSWLLDLRQLVRSHERFTWINLALSLTPSPPAGFLALILAILQLFLVSKNKIPRSERNILFISLILAICNLVITIIAIQYLASKGESLWHSINPLLWFNTIRDKLSPSDTIEAFKILESIVL